MFHYAFEFIHPFIVGSLLLFFCRFVWLFRLKSVILGHDILLKSVVFVCQKLLKSVNGYAVQEDYIIHRGLSEVR